MKKIKIKKESSKSNTVSFSLTQYGHVLSSLTASYNGKDLKIDTLVINKTTVKTDDYGHYPVHSMKPLPCIKGKKAWDLFYKHATFDGIMRNICRSFSLNISDLLEMQSAFDEEREFLNTIREDISAASPRQDPLDEEREFLNTIRDNPFILRVKKYINWFIGILLLSRYAIDREVKNRFKYLLSSNLIPKDQGGKKPLPSEIDLLIELLKKLAIHLSKKCKKILKDVGYIEKTDFNFKNKDAYKTLIKWAENNKEHRISMLSEKNLKTLILTPASVFVKNLIKSCLNVSPKTLNRRKKIKEMGK